MNKWILFLHACFVSLLQAQAQPIPETGCQQMPTVWIAKDSHHKIVRLAGNGRTNMSLYFHNIHFMRNSMAFYSSEAIQPGSEKAVKQETCGNNLANQQLYIIDLKTLASTAVTKQPSPANGEIMDKKMYTFYYQLKNCIFITGTDSKQTEMVYVFSADCTGSITALNADETLPAGAWPADKEKNIHSPGINGAPILIRLLVKNYFVAMVVLKDRQPRHRIAGGSMYLPLVAINQRLKTG